MKNDLVRQGIGYYGQVREALFLSLYRITLSL
jgi:hypothetical protein